MALEIAGSLHQQNKYKGKEIELQHEGKRAIVNRHPYSSIYDGLLKDVVREMWGDNLGKPSGRGFKVGFGGVEPRNSK